MNDIETRGYGYDITTETTAMSGTVLVKSKVVKRFRGETAWSDAERYAEDLAVKERYAK